jgi:hypothetical protein
MGLMALRHDGVHATDGFMQVMMAMRGRTEMERLVLEQGLVDANAATQELEDLKIRYGKLLVKGGGEEIQGFGTEDETIPLRKGK